MDKTIKITPGVKTSPAIGINGLKSNADNTNSIHDVYYVPFVRDSQNYVNASMVINASLTDTTISYLCDWQYREKPHGSVQLNTTAESHALFFMLLDNRTLGHTEFNITDASLFSESGTNQKKKKLGIVARSDRSATGNVRVSAYQQVCAEYYICGSPDYPGCIPYCDYENCFSPGTCYLLDTQCYAVGSGGGGGSTAIGGYVGGSGTGGGGNGGGDPGGSTPPVPPCGGPETGSIPNTDSGRVVINSMPCGDAGWAPDDYAFTTEDRAILDDLQGEKEVAENFANDPTPCHGTRRLPGSTVIQPQATVAHLMIQEAYIASEPFAEAEYYIPGSGVTGNKGYADLVNKLRGEIFEIKPVSLVAQGEAEAQRYVAVANVNCPPISTFSQWQLGTQFVSRDLPDPLNPSQVIHAESPTPGVITYDSRPRATNPLPAPMPSTLPGVIKELMKRRRLNPSGDFPELALAFLRKLSETQSGQLLVSRLKTEMTALAAVLLVGYVAQAIYTDGVGLFTQTELVYTAKDFIFIVQRL